MKTAFTLIPESVTTNYSAIQLGPVKVDTVSLHNAATRCSALTERLNQVRQQLLTTALNSSNPNSNYATLIAWEVENLRWQLLQAEREMEALTARLYHGEQLYQQAENEAQGLFGKALGVRTQYTVNEAADWLGTPIAMFSLTGLTVSEYCSKGWRRWFNDKVGAGTSKTLRTHLAYAPLWKVPQILRREATYLAAAAQKAVVWDKRLTTQANTRLEVASARLSRAYPAFEKISGQYQARLHVQPVSKSGLSLPGKSLWRSEIAYSPQTVTELLKNDHRPLPASKPVGSVMVPQTVSSLLERTQLVRDHPQGKVARTTVGQRVSAGEIELIRYSQPGGVRQSWTVVIKGTQEWLPGATTPHDMQTNFAALGGVRSDQEAAVITALQMAGAHPGDAIELVGHSQGGIVAADLAANPEINRVYQVAQVVTAGSPVGGIDIPEGVRVLSFEHLQDPVAGLEGRNNPQRSNWLTYSVSGESSLGGSGDVAAKLHHNIEGYVQASKSLENSSDAVIAQWNEQRLGALGITSETRADYYRFTALRE